MSFNCYTPLFDFDNYTFKKKKTNKKKGMKMK